MLNPDFRDMLSALCDENAEFLLIGAYALAANAYLGILIADRELNGALEEGTQDAHITASDSPGPR